jgi:MFS family permease
MICPASASGCDWRCTCAVFFAATPPAKRRTFCQRLPELLAPRARRTRRLAQAQASVAVAVGGEAGARDLTTIALCLSGGFFLIELTIGPIWAIPMDIAPKFSGSASGIMNAGAALAAIISPVVFGYIVDVTGNWTLPFIGSIVLLVAGAVLAFFMKPERPFHVTVTSAADDATTLREPAPVKPVR